MGKLERGRELARSAKKTFQEIGKYERTWEDKKETQSENYLEIVAMRTKVIDLEIKDTREV